MAKKKGIKTDDLFAEFNKVYLEGFDEGGFIKKSIKIPKFYEEWNRKEVEKTFKRALTKTLIPIDEIIEFLKK